MTMMLAAALAMLWVSGPAESRQPVTHRAAAADGTGAFEAQPVRQVVLSAVESVDARRWESLRDTLSESVFVDYTSLFGGQPRDYAADELVDNWRQLLEPFSMTKHFLGPIVIDGEGGVARAECPVHIYHFLRGALGGEEWGVLGHFVFTLEKRNGTWRIQKLVLNAQSQYGNTDLLVEAFARAAGERAPQGEPQSPTATNLKP